jgi:hypothetical protein
MVTIVHILEIYIVLKKADTGVSTHIIHFISISNCTVKLYTD